MLTMFHRAAMPIVWGANVDSRTERKHVDIDRTVGPPDHRSIVTESVQRKLTAQWSAIRVFHVQHSAVCNTDSDISPLN